MKARRHAAPIRPLALLLGAVSLACLLCGSARAEEQFSADAVKAAYLYRITAFVHWPGAWPADAPFTIDVLGDPIVADELGQLLPGHAVQGHPARVQVIRRIGDVGNAQMLYIGPGFTGDIRTAVASIADRPILIVTDEEQGLADGSTINFVETGDHVRLEVSLVAAGRARLDISSQLLSVATHVVGGHLGSGMDCARDRLTEEAGFNCATRVWVRWAVGERGSLR